MKWGKITILVVLLLSGVAGSANACDMNELKLPASLASSLAAGHPWVYRDHVGRFRARSGDWVKFHAGSLQGWGLWDEEGSIALRVYSLVQRPNENWVRERVREAWSLREETRRRGVSGYRLIFGEADAFPGLVVDLYAGYAILVAYSKSVGSVIPWLSTALMELSEIKGVMRRRKVEQQVTLSVLAGEQAPEEVVIREGRMKLLAELTRGQKTGLFFDHRENRAHVGARAANRDVLNLFSYTGGFSVAAALGGAKSVTSVDLAQPAIDACTRNFELNELSGFEHQGIAADVFLFLQNAQKKKTQWDYVICDPPSFARSADQRKGAEKAYRKLMTQALGVVRPGGYFCAASCTSQIGPAHFRRILAEASRAARLRLQIVHEVGQPFDHPVAIGHEEGRYLKFIEVRVLARV